MCSYLDGLMIGDGSIGMHGNVSARLQIGRQLKHAPYNEWLMRQLSNYKWSTPFLHESKSKINGRLIQSHQHRIRTNSSRELAKEYVRWYPNGKRAIPYDFQWTPEALAVAFMDDGTTSASVIKNKVSAIAQLYLCNFSQEEVLGLADGIRQTFGIKCSVQQNRTKPIITFSGIPQVTKLIETIYPIVKNIPVMHYKIALEEKIKIKRDTLQSVYPIVFPWFNGPNTGPFLQSCILPKAEAL